MVTTSCIAGRAGPGELLLLVMDGLAGCGLDVRRGEDNLLAIAWPGGGARWRSATAAGPSGSTAPSPRSSPTRPWPPTWLPPC